MPHPIRTLFIALAILLLVGCSEDPPPPVDANANAVDEAASVDIESTFRDMAAALQLEHVVLAKAVRDWSALDDADYDSFRNAIAEQRRTAADFMVLIEANPTWIGRACEWYSAVIAGPHLKVMNTRHALFGMPSGTRSRYATLLLDAFGSTEASRAYLEWRGDHPGSAENIHLMCIKFGHLEGDGE